jgi:hypothetical protein
MIKYPDILQILPWVISYMLIYNAHISVKASVMDVNNIATKVPLLHFELCPGHNFETIRDINMKLCTHLSRGYLRISWKMVRKDGIMISRSSLNVGYLGSKTRSHCPNMDKPCLHSRGYYVDPNIPEIGEKGCLYHFYLNLEYRSSIVKN